MKHACDHALSIWHAGIEAVRADRLVAQSVRLTKRGFSVLENMYSLDDVDRVCVVGAGKAAGYLAMELERVLQPIAKQIGLHGWINVPDNCIEPSNFVHLHAGRPAGINEPRAEGVAGTQQILKLVSQLGPRDLCLCLLTGGGSALLPAPKPGLTLEDKQTVTRQLSAKGVSIQQLNRVRTAMSDVKGGGLSRACTAGNLETLIVSDVIGDPIEIIASGPTVDVPRDRTAARIILADANCADDLPKSVQQFFAAECFEEDDQTKESDASANPNTNVVNSILANNATAVDAAKEHAQKLGFAVVTLPPEPPSQTAEASANQLVQTVLERATEQSRADGPLCILWGGEPVVKLCNSAERGKGGRNQQLVLAALSKWKTIPQELKSRLCMLSAGTDGEDGPTDAAGAFVDNEIVSASTHRGLDAEDFLRRNDAYMFFDKIDGLIRTGPTHTNVCDLRVAIVL